MKIYKSNGYNELKNKGLSLLNKAIVLNLSNISLGNKTYLKGLFLDESYLKQAKPYQFEKIYNILFDENEKDSFIKDLYSIGKKYKYNQYHYSVLQFFENINLDKNNIIKLIDELENFYN